MRVVGQRNALTKEHFILMRIPKRFWTVTFAQIESDLQEIVRNYLNNMDQMLDEGHGLLFWGENGRGKTSAAAFVAREVRRTGASVLMVTSASLIESVIEKTEVEEGLLLDRARSVDFLLLDDLGKEHSTKTGFSERALENLFRDRSSSHLTTFVTTNMSFDGLIQRYKKSMLEVMKEILLPVKVEGRDFREDAKETLKKSLAVM